MDKINNIGLSRELTSCYDFHGFTEQEVWSRIAQKINIVIEHFNYLDKKIENEKANNKTLIKEINDKISIIENESKNYVTIKWNGNKKQTIAIPLKKLSPYIKLPFIMTIFSQKNDIEDGGVKCYGTGLISCSSTVLASSITFMEIGSREGLDSSPIIKLDSGSKELVIEFTPITVDGTNDGVLYMQFGY